MVDPESATNLLESLRGLVRSARASAVRDAHPGLLPPPIAALLVRLDCAAGNRPSAVAAELQVTQSALSRQVTHAESLGYLERTPDPLDGRASLLALSEAGTNALRAHREAQLQWIRSVLADWTDHEVDALTALVERMRHALGPDVPAVAGAR